MAEQLQPISADSLSQLHPRAVEDPEQVQSLLGRVYQQGLRLLGARSRGDDPESAVIEAMEPGILILRTENFEESARSHVVLNFSLDGVAYFFSSRRLAGAELPQLRLDIPPRIYQAERRDRGRTSIAGSPGVPLHVLVSAPGRRQSRGRVADLSPDGLGLELPKGEGDALGSQFEVRFLDGELAGERRWVRVRHTRPAARNGWVRLGLATSSVPHRQPAPVERHQTILPGGRLARVQRRLSLLAAGARVASARSLERVSRKRVALPEIRTVDYRSPAGEPLRAIVDGWGSERDAVAVVIPPAWGRTKETLLPLAATIVASFRRARVPVVVVRFDGIRKRGESYNDPECREPGAENRHFTVYQGVRDIQSTLDFLEHSAEFEIRRAILVTFSASSIEGRRAMLEDGGRRLLGWVSVVGAPDLQSGLRKVSGGIDYLGGAERGLRFGVQELMGVTADMEGITRDALDHRLAFLEDARREMAEIAQPITWIHGRYDAWLDLDRVREIMACGDHPNRRLLEVPTGHQLRSSREAFQVFQLVAGEIGRLALGRALAPSLPDLTILERRRRAERKRLPKTVVDLREFWKRYLVGRDGSLGIELMNATRAYEELMDVQIQALGLEEGQRVADLGAGTGPFALRLAAADSTPTSLIVDAVDYVPAALTRGRQRMARLGAPAGLTVNALVADFELLGRNRSLPLAAGAYDAVLASLLLSYLREPLALLRAARDLLRPGGRLVLSSLRRDADISRLYVEGVEELRGSRWRAMFSDEEEQLIDESVRTFLNDAAHIIDFEEQGAFRFWDGEELTALVREAGFRQVHIRTAFGEPPQAVVVSARKP